jgi:hypothetical protein
MYHRTELAYSPATILKKSELACEALANLRDNEKQYSAPQQQPMVPYQQHYQGPPQHQMTVQQPYAHPGQVTIPEEKKNRFGKIGSKVRTSVLFS